LDSNNIEANKMLGELYYSLFNEQINISDSSSERLRYYASSVQLYYKKLYKLKNQTIETSRYPLIQVLNYLGDKIQSDQFENIRLDSSNLYFPVELFAELPNDWRTNYKLDVIWKINVTSFVINWYSGQLEALKEPRLINNSSDKQIFRFTWLRSFNNPIAIRIEKWQGKVNICWKLCNGAGGNIPGDLIIDKRKELTEKEWQDFSTLLQNIDFWNIKTVKEENGNDGSQWILEGIDKNNYHVVDRWTPRGSDYQKCCLYLLDLTDLNIKTDDIY
jgi:hypothetical protein